jgi:TonB family protein
MGSPLITKLPGRTLGNLAFACSLFLHVGIIVLISSWQWEWQTTSRNQTQVVKVKFIPPPTTQKEIQKTVPEKMAELSPAQPVATTSSTIPALKARTPKASVPAPQPASWTNRTTPSQIKHFKPRKLQPPPIPSTEATARSVQSLKIIQRNAGATQKAVVRMIPSRNTHQAESVRAVTPVKVRATGQLNVVQRRVPAGQKNLSNTSIAMPQSASLMEASNSVLKNIHQRPVPGLTSINVNPPVQPAVEPLSSPMESRTHLAILPRKPNYSPFSDQNIPDAGLSVLRGKFTDKVRQKIAKAKHYPRMARRRGMEGQPVITFTLDKQGRLAKADLEQTSGHQLLDQAALEAVHQAAPYPEIPDELKVETYQFKLPISFVLK